MITRLRLCVCLKRHHSTSTSSRVPSARTRSQQSHPFTGEDVCKRHCRNRVASLWVWPQPFRNTLWPRGKNEIIDFPPATATALFSQWNELHLPEPKSEPVNAPENPEQISTWAASIPFRQRYFEQQAKMNTIPALPSLGWEYRKANSAHHIVVAYWSRPSTYAHICPHPHW